MKKSQVIGACILIALLFVNTGWNLVLRQRVVDLEFQMEQVERYHQYVAGELDTSCNEVPNDEFELAPETRTRSTVFDPTVFEMEPGFLYTVVCSQGRCGVRNAEDIGYPSLEGQGLLFHQAPLSYRADGTLTYMSARIETTRPVVCDGYLCQYFLENEEVVEFHLDARQSFRIVEENTSAIVELINGGASRCRSSNRCTPDELRQVCMGQFPGTTCRAEDGFFDSSL